ncbi:MAG: right-handed parallel beta-helix repeat-containing protein [Isosphaeraceae bacterium]
MARKSSRRSCRPACDPLESRALLATFQVINTRAVGAGSLSRAIELANNKPGTDTITFNIPGDGNHEIPMAGLLGVSVKSKVIIDGYTQPGSARNTSSDPAANNAKVLVTIKNLASSGPALAFWGKGASGSQMRGIRVVSLAHSQSGIEIRNADNVKIDGCAFSGEQNSRLTQAIIIRNGNRNTIGGNVAWTPALQNVMNTYNVGVDLIGNSQHNAIVSNLIGGEPGQSQDPLQKVGVLVQRSARNNTITRNLLYKNITQLKIESTNTVDDNTFVDR